MLCRKFELIPINIGFFMNFLNSSKIGLKTLGENSPFLLRFLQYIMLCFIIGCSLTCSDGYTVNSNCTACNVTMCDRDSPCMNGGQCIQYSPPDNYTCNCTGTRYKGVNCTGE